MLRGLRLAHPFWKVARSMSVVRSSENTGPIEELIIAKISASLAPKRLVVTNDSHKHRHHRSMQDAENVQELHFRLEVVSDSFVGKNMPARHRLIYKLLDDEFQNQGCTRCRW